MDKLTEVNISSIIKCEANDKTYNKLVIDNLTSYNKISFLKIILLQNFVPNNVKGTVFHIQQKIPKFFKFFNYNNVH